MDARSPGVGTPNHLGGAMLMTLAGIEILHVPYKGSALAMADLIAGTIHLTITGSDHEQGADVA